MKNKTYYDAKEVAEIVGCKLNTAYKIIRELNNELKSKGFIVFQGKINKRYFQKHYLMPDDNIGA